VTSLPGMSFHTVLAVSAAPRLQPMRHPTFQSPLRPSGYTFTNHDYGSYESGCSFWLGQRGTRAALLAGGILWRLAYEHMTPGVVLDGPEEITRARANGFVLTPQDARTVYVDDVLSASEVWLLIGGYDVATGIRHQSSRPSWWPRPELWEASSFNVGFWSPVAESWFVQRREKYRAGQAQPLTRPQWQQSIKKGDKRALHLTRELRSAASARIGEVCDAITLGLPSRHVAAVE
jgi:hypothetical protein